MNGDDLLLSNSGGTKSINVETNIFARVSWREDMSDTEPVDIVFFFDCCYSYLETREPMQAKRVVEILAAVDEAAIDEASETAFSPIHRASFTGTVANELIARKNAGEQSVELAELIAHLREVSHKKPTHRMLVGVHSIRLPIPGNESRTTLYLSPGPAVHAL